jgi:hypothetical protein
MDFRNSMNLLYVTWNCCCRGGFYLCVQHFEDELEGWIINDSEWSVALEDPTWDEISKFGLIVCRSMRVAGDALGWIDNSAIAGLDVAKKICRRIFLAFTSQNDWGVTIASWDWMSRKKRNEDLRATNKLILYDIVLHNYNWCLEVAITSWRPIFNLGFYMEGTRYQKKKVGMIRRLTKNIFVRFSCGFVSLLECWEFGSNLARSFACRRWFSGSLSACVHHAWRNGSSSNEFSVKLCLTL